MVTLCFVPLIGLMKGWGVGPESRFLPSVLSLGLVLGWTALFLAVRAGVLRISSSLVWLLALPVAGLVLVDGHRSVWLVALAVLLTLLVVGEIGSAHISGWIRRRAVVGLILVAVVPSGSTPCPTLRPAPSIHRARERRDGAAGVRCNGRRNWRSGARARSPAKASAATGRRANSTENGRLSPQPLRADAGQAGARGLALMGAVAVSIAVAAGTSAGQIPSVGSARRLDYVLVVMGLVALVAVLVYGVAYALDYYALLLSDSGTAAAVHHGATSSGRVLVERVGLSGRRCKTRPRLRLRRHAPASGVRQSFGHRENAASDALKAAAVTEE